MKMCYESVILYVLLIVTLYTANLSGTVQAITGGRFDPPLVPTTNLAETADSHLLNRVIVDDATLIGIEINDLLYTDVEGPTNAVVFGGDDFWPINGTPTDSLVASITNLTLRFFNNVKTADVYFASTVDISTDGGFFFSEFGSSDDIYVYPLGNDGQPIGTWQLHLVDANYGGDKLLAPHGSHLYGEISEGTLNAQQIVGGAAFTLNDFTGGEGTLNNVTGLRIIDPYPACDPVMLGIYRGPAKSVVYQAGRAVMMRNATFSQTPVNPMTNDFALTGFAGAESVTGPSAAYQFDSRNDSLVLWPSNGIQPTRTNALLGLEINGLRNLEYWDFMFADPVTNANDGFFIIDDVYSRDTVYVYPLDADRRPISTYSIITFPYFYQWDSPSLMNSYYVKWNGSFDSSPGNSRIGGVVMPLSAFAGGTGGLTSAYGIRVYSNSQLDALVVGSYTAWKYPRPVYNIETDPMPGVTPSADHLSGTIRHDWTLTSITLDSGRYTDLEGPASATGVGNDYWYPIDGTDPGSGAAAVLGLDGSGLVNDDAVSYFFDTTVTNGFDGGYFVFESGGEDSYSFQPIGVDSNIISGYTVVIDKNRDMIMKVENHLGLQCVMWREPYNETHARDHYGAAFTINCFTNGVSESLTNDVIGMKIKYNVYGNADVLMVGIYKGPPVPLESGIGYPMTGATYTPDPGSQPYSNDAAVASVQCAYTESLRVRGPVEASVYKHHGDWVYYPFNGISPDPTPGTPHTEGYTNALVGLSMDGILQTYITEYMFDKPVNQSEDGFFIIEHSGNDTFMARPLDAGRHPISSYSAQIELSMYGSLDTWNMNIWGDGPYSSAMKGVMIRLCDFVGGTEPLGQVYGIRLENLTGELDPAVVGQWLGPIQGTVILVR